MSVIKAFEVTSLMDIMTQQRVFHLQLAIFSIELVPSWPLSLTEHLRFFMQNSFASEPSLHQNPPDINLLKNSLPYILRTISLYTQNCCSSIVFYSILLNSVE